MSMRYEIKTPKGGAEFSTFDFEGLLYVLHCFTKTTARHTKHRIQNPSTNIRLLRLPRFVLSSVRNSRVVAAASYADSALPSDTAGRPSRGLPATLHAAAECKSDSSHSELGPARSLESASVRRPDRRALLHTGAKIGKIGALDNFAVHSLRTALRGLAPTPVDDQALEFF
jgi:hypothetical protein